MQLIIDIGNTRKKFALFKEQTFLFKTVGNDQDLIKLLEENPIKRAIISSVASHDKIESVLLKCKVSYIHLSAKTRLPIRNNYLTPTTLGDDRLANVVGANALFPNQNVLTIDCGTCIKYDMVTQKKEYSGGAISPGLTMRFKALHNQTKQLPLLEKEQLNYVIGKSSKESILSGVINGTIAEIDGIILKYKELYDNLTVILTGGDTKFFEKELKCNIFAEPNLTLIGLNEILHVNS